MQSIEIRMSKRRCPWCGENLKENRFIKGKELNFQCKNCKRWSFPCENKSVLSFYILAFSLAFLSEYKLIFLVLVATIYSFFYMACVPYKRIYYEDEVKDLELQELKIGEATIQWVEREYKIFKLWDNKIFIITFIKENEPVSIPICVRIKKGKKLFFLNQIDFRLTYEYKSGSKFVIFEERREVGQGILK